MKKQQFIPLILLFFTTHLLGQDTELWAMTYRANSIIKLNKDRQCESFEVFGFLNGDDPAGSLTQGSDGKLYGMTSNSGGGGNGTIFCFDSKSNVFTKLHDFNLTNGGVPYGSLIQGIDGKLYGLTSVGGSSGGLTYGTIFSYDIATSTFSKIHEFNDTDGNRPHGSLIQATDGKLYGTTRLGGSLNEGTIFSFDPVSNVFMKIHDFDGTNGRRPEGSLTQGIDGRLYGTTRYGGSSLGFGYGTIFSFDITNNSFSKIHVFDNTNGAEPTCSLIQGTDGKFYGMTSLGGQFGNGTIFSYDLTSGYSVLENFDGVKGRQPYGSLLQGSDGKFYGMAGQGGDFEYGTIFSYDLTLGYSVLEHFDGVKGRGPLYNSFIEVTLCAPTTLTLDIVNLPDLTGECSVEQPIAPTATNNCGEQVTGTTTTIFPIVSQGETTIIWSFEDSEGNTTSQEQVVIIDDLSAPVADLVNLPVLSGICNIEITNAPTATDNCGNQITGTTTTLFPITDQSITSITWVYDDGRGNTSTQNQTIEFNDTESPIADALTLDVVTAECELMELIEPSASDNCGDVEVSHNTVLPITETTTVTWTYSDEAGNQATQTQEVIITSPDIDNTITIEGTTIVASETNGDSYQWYKCNPSTIIEGAESSTYEPAITGNYSVAITKSCNQVSSDCSEEFIVTSSSSISSDQEFKVFPNPAQDRINIVSNGKGNFEIYSSKGELLTTSTENNIDVSNLHEGVYLIKQEGRVTRFVKQ